jgi:acylphosphatase
MARMAERIVRVVVTGRVQGVAFRDFVQREARARGVGGWVRNRRDGAVEALFAGAPEIVAEMLAACWRGPPASRVADVRVTEADAEDASAPDAGFSILPTAG